MERATIIRNIDQMVAQHRDQCLWFLRPDFFPRDDHMRLKALEYIQRHGTREAALQAAELAQWLSQVSSDTSAAS